LILAAFVARVPGARAAALVDAEGETVDYAGSIDPFELRLAAAHWRLVLDEASAQRSMTSAENITIRASRRSYLISVLPDGYALVTVLVRGAGFSGTKRALAVCASALSEEAGWTWDGLATPPLWFSLDVVADAKLRPRGVRLGSTVRPLEIIGSLVAGVRGAANLRRFGERAWRVRFDSGVEAMLVRERGGAWYADEPLE
jgi:hypothetical protein